MRLLDRLLGSSRAGFNPAQASGASVLMQAFGSPDAEKVLPTFLNAASAFGSNAVVYGLERARVALFSEAEFKFQRKADLSLYGSQALELLENPWPGGTTSELLAKMELHAALSGNAFVRRVRSANPALVPDRLEMLRPDWVTIVSGIFDDANGDEYREVIGYLYEPPAIENRDTVTFDVSEVAHWSPMPDPLAEFRGMSWLTPVLREIDADVQMTDYKRAYLTNAATPNMLVAYKGELGEAKRNALADHITARHGGVGNAFKTLILDEGADVTVLGNNFEQMAFTAVQSAGENRIAVAAGVPPIVASLKEGLAASTLANYDNAMRSFADLTMRPLWRSACTALAKLVEVPSDSRLWFNTSGIAALRQGEKDLADTLQVQAATASTLITAGYEPESVVTALSAGDITLLKHSGMVSVQLQEPGAAPAATASPARSDDLEPIAARADVPAVDNETAIKIAEIEAAASEREAEIKAANKLAAIQLEFDLEQSEPKDEADVKVAEIKAAAEVQAARIEAEAEKAAADAMAAGMKAIADGLAQLSVVVNPSEVAVVVDPTPVTVANSVALPAPEVTVVPTQPTETRAVATVIRDEKGEIVATETTTMIVED